MCLLPIIGPLYQHCHVSITNNWSTVSALSCVYHQSLVHCVSIIMCLSPIIGPLYQHCHVSITNHWSTVSALSCVYHQSLVHCVGIIMCLSPIIGPLYQHCHVSITDHWSTVSALSCVYHRSLSHILLSCSGRCPLFISESDIVDECRLLGVSILFVLEPGGKGRRASIVEGQLLKLAGLLYQLTENIITSLIMDNF